MNIPEKVFSKLSILQSVSGIFLIGFFFSCQSKKACELAFEDVKLFDGTRMYAHANVYLNEGYIVQVDTIKTAIDRPCKTIVDGRQKTLIPGMIDAHTHPQSRSHLSEMAQSGILATMDLLRLTEDSIPVFKSLSSQAGYADYYTAGIGADMPDAVIKMYIQKQNPWAPTTKKEIALFMQDRMKSKVDFIKVFQDSRLPEKFPDSLFDKIISEIHQHKKLAIVHSETYRDARYAIHHGADIVAHGWVDSLADCSELKEWKKRGIYLMPTLYIHTLVKKKYHSSSYTLSEEEMIAEIGKLHKAGIPLLAGSDAPAHGLNFTNDFYKELALYCKAGLSPCEALQTATSNPAKAFGLSDKGTIKKGNPANLVLINGDVITDISKINQVSGVWKKGEKIR
jgi:imidazolonepropionase-like amidohydrolase